MAIGTSSRPTGYVDQGVPGLTATLTRPVYSQYRTGCPSAAIQYRHDTL